MKAEVKKDYRKKACDVIYDGKVIRSFSAYLHMEDMDSGTMESAAELFAEGFNAGLEAK